MFFIKDYDMIDYDIDMIKVEDIVEGIRIYILNTKLGLKLLSWIAKYHKK